MTEQPLESGDDSDLAVPASSVVQLRTQPNPPALQSSRKDGYGSRYADAMVADVHRVLLQGGIFLYPPTAKAPKGKLRLMYEANPMAMILEQASGVDSTGYAGFLDLQPASLHERVPVILGSALDVAALQAELAAD